MDPVTVVVRDKDVSGLRVLVPNLIPVPGRVIVEGGGPFPRFQLTFMRIDAPSPANAPIPVTLANRFTAPLPPGEYRISSTGLPNGYSLKSVIGDATDLLNQPLKVEAGASSPITVTLAVSSPPPWVQVHGRITGNFAINAPVRVTMNSSAVTETLTVTAEPDGSFEFSKVLPGSYSAMAISATSVSTPVTVTVGTTNLTDLAIRLPEPKEISGRVDLQSKLPLPIHRLGLSLAPIAGIPASGASLPVNLLPDGSFKIALPPGERRISLVTDTIPPGYKLVSFLYGTTDLLKSPLRIALTEDAELRITFDAPNAAPVSVSGQVTGLLYTKGVRVVLMNPFFDPIEAPVNPDGSFVFSKVGPGNYSARLSLSGLSASTAVAVGNLDVTNIVIAYPREFIVTGHIIVEGGAAGNAPPVTLEANDAKTGATRRSNIANNGVMLLSVKDGEHNISVRSLPSAYRIKSIMYGTVDLQKAPLKIDGPPTWEIIVRVVPQ
jgi:hypothetical protein